MRRVLEAATQVKSSGLFPRLLLENLGGLCGALVKTVTLFRGMRMRAAAIQTA